MDDYHRTCHTVCPLPHKYTSWQWPTLLSALLMISGCIESPTKAPVSRSTPQDHANTPTTPGTVKNGQGQAEQEITLTPENTKIQFVGVHSPPKDPEPRTGHFQDFQGKAVVANGTLQKVSVEIQTDSIKTDFDKLTDHLRGADFFDSRQHPTATFESTKIEAVDGKTLITGNLTLLGKTGEIQLQCSTTPTDTGIALEGETTIDRTAFGMTFGEGQVEKSVQLTVKIGSN